MKLIKNWGVIFAILVLLALVILNYNRCYVAVTEKFADIEEVTASTVSTGTGVTTTTPITMPALSQQEQLNKQLDTIFPPPQNVRVDVTPTSCTVNFGVTLDTGSPIPQKMLIVLAKYDKNRNQVGSTNIYLSDEYVLNNAQAANPNIIQNVCQILNGVPSCQYTFTDLIAKDQNGESYNYKVGVSAIYANGNSAFVGPSNIKADYFILDKSIDLQTAAFQEYLNYIGTQNAQSALSQGINNGIAANTLATADGQYEIMRQQLGNYPDNLEISEENIRTGALTDLIDKSMALGKVVINVKSG